MAIVKKDIDVHCKFVLGVFVGWMRYGFCKAFVWDVGMDNMGGNIAEKNDDDDANGYNDDWHNSENVTE